MADFTIEGQLRMAGVRDVEEAMRVFEGMGKAGPAAAAGVGGLNVALAATAVVASAVVAGLALMVRELVQVGEESVKVAAKYETAMTKITALTNAQPKVVDEWRQSLLQLSAETGKVPEELAKGLYFIASSGIVGADALKLLEAAAKGSAAGLGETETISKGLVSVFNAYKETGLTAAQAMDIFTATVREGGAQADQLSGVIGRAAGVAANFGVSFQEVGAFIATYTRVIPDAAQATTSLRQLILNLEAPSKQTKDALHALGLSVDEVNASIRTRGLMATLDDLIKRTHGNAEMLHDLIPNVRALAGAMATAGSQGADYATVLQRINASAGTLDYAFNTMKTTLAFQWSQVTAQFEAMYVQIGMALMPAIKELAESALPALISAMQTLGAWVAAHSGDFLEFAKNIEDTASGFMNLLEVLATIAKYTGLGILVQEIRNLVALTGEVDGFGSALARALAAVATMGMSEAIIAMRDMGREARLAGEEANKAADAAKREEEAAKRFAAQVAMDLQRLNAILLAALKLGAGGGGGKATEEWAAAMKKAFDLVGDAGGKTQMQVDAIAEAVRKVGIDAAAFDDVAKKLIELSAKGAELPPILQAVVEKFIMMQAAVAFLKDRVAANTDEVKRYFEEVRKGQVAVEDWKKTAGSAFEEQLALARQLLIEKGQDESMQKRVNAALLEEARQLLATGSISQQEFERRKKALEETKEKTDKCSEALQNMAAIFKLLGISADSALGQILGGLTVISEKMKDWTGAISKIGQGSGISFATNLLSGITGALGLASAAFAIGKAIFSLFKGKSPAQKAAEEAGAMLGVTLTEEMGKKILALAKQLGISIHNATLLMLTDIAQTTGKALASMLPQIQELMRAVASGAIPAKEGIEEIGRAFSTLRDEAAAAGEVASRAMLVMIQQARALGQEIPEIAAYVAEQLGQAIEALPSLFENLPIVTEEDAIAQAQIFSAVFWAKVREDGIVAAATALLPAWEAIKKSLLEAGIDRSVVEAIFGTISPIMRLVHDDVTGPILQGIDALNQSLLGLANSGYMTMGAFQAFEQQAQSAYDRLIAAGVAPELALQAIAPLLANLQAVAQQYGLTLDENTQRLIAQAEAAGVAFPTDPMMQVIDLLGQIVVLLGGTLPDAAQTTANAFTNTSQTAIDGADTVRQAWQASMAEIAADAQDSGVTIKNAFSDVADAAGEDGDYVGVVWAQNIDEIAFHALRQVDPVTAAFEAIADGAIDPANKVADAVGGIVDELRAIPGAAQHAQDSLDNFDNGGGGKGGNNHQQHAQHGLFVPPRPGGQMVNVTGGTPQGEVIAPVKALLRDIGGEIARQLAGTGGGGAPGSVTVVIDLGSGRVLAETVNAGLRDGTIVVPESALKKVG